jgi:hypothetical protein
MAAGVNLPFCRFRIKTVRLLLQPVTLLITTCRPNLLTYDEAASQLEASIAICSLKYLCLQKNDPLLHGES